jgi:hypothetical protein
MKSRNAASDGTIVVVPQERPPQVKQYLAMVTSLDRAIGARRKLDVNQLLKFAQSRTGAMSLSADSDLHFEGLRCLAGSMQRDSCYDGIGMHVANYYAYNWIRKYVQFEGDLTTFPDILRVPVPKPMFLVGFGRTGSTFLHHLLALDPRARASRLCELTESSPPPLPESHDTDPRICQVQMHISFKSIVMPDGRSDAGIHDHAWLVVGNVQRQMKVRRPVR